MTVRQNQHFTGMVTQMQPFCRFLVTWTGSLQIKPSGSGDENEMQLEVILAGNRLATKPSPSKRVKPGIKKKPRWHLENGVLVQTPKHPKHYSGYTYIITMDRFLVE